MCCTSIFYWLSVLGFRYFIYTKPVFSADSQLAIIAECQRYYLLGHAAMLHGLLKAMKYPVRTPYRVEIKNYPGFLVQFATGALLISSIVSFIPGFQQFLVQLHGLSLIAGTLALAFAIPQRKPISILFSFLLFSVNLLQALRSGFKEPIIVCILILGIFLFPFYKRAVVLFFIPLLLITFMLLPTYNTIFRESAWQGNVDAETASSQALGKLLSGDNLSSYGSIKDETNWGFLTSRLSEIELFTKYVQSTPADIPFYNTNIALQAVSLLVPRVFWPNKPYTEGLVMERVYQAGIINRLSTVSAKPQYIVDGYLSAGILGIWIALFIYGYIAQWLAMKAEYLFGGYLIGSALVFTGLFQILWRGLSFEFIFNTVFWSTVSMYLLHFIFRFMRIIKMNR
jgi:hypothetical protein